MNAVTDADWYRTEELWGQVEVCNCDMCNQKTAEIFSRHREYGYNTGYYDGRNVPEQDITRQIVAMINEKYASVIAESIIADIEAGNWKQK